MESHSVAKVMGRSESEVILLLRFAVVEGFKRRGGRRDDECRESLIGKQSWSVEIRIDDSCALQRVSTAS